MWRQFSTRVDSLSGEWVAELQALSQKWRHSRGYFVPDEEAVEMRLSALRRIASSLSALVEDLEDNAKWTKPVQFFLSYSHKDEGLATSLVSDLRAEGFSVWRDLERIRVGESIRQRVEAGIEESTFLLVLLSPNSVDSDWVRDEIDMALSVEKELGRTFLLPITVGSFDVPRLLKGRRWVSFDDYNEGLSQLLHGLPET